MKLLTIILALGCLAGSVHAQETLFHDDFRGRLGEGWSWVREHREAWRVTERGLEVRIEPGNMWGPQNNARNVLVRPAPDARNAEIEISARVENNPTNQYEQTDLVWYYDDSNMVKLGQELVDGKLSVVMGREEGDRTRTVAIIPITSTSVQLRLVAKDGHLRGQFRIPSESDWREVGQCTMPTGANKPPKISLQFYQGAEEARHWARVTDFSVVRGQKPDP
jgi:regulation of enolase protein 1 (concanavalin A-like superfamily)